jgi:hypothetical protein
VPNRTGVLLSDQKTQVGESMQYYAPINVIVIGKGDKARVVVPVSNPNQVGSELQNSVYIYGIPNGTFQESPEIITMLGNPWEVAEGDFVGDDEPEIAIVDRMLSGTDLNATQQGMLRFYTYVQSQPAELTDYRREIIRGPTSLAAADLDCDDKTDLVIGSSSISSEGAGTVQVLFGATSPTKLRLVEVEDTEVGAGPHMAVADFDCDGRPDVAIPDFGNSMNSGQRVLFLGAGSM